MSRSARVASIKEALAQTTIALAVVVRDGEGVIPEAVPTNLGGVVTTRTLTKEWCTRQGLKEEPGSTVVLRSLTGANIVIVSLGSSAHGTFRYRLAGAAAARAAGDVPLSDGRTQ